MTSNFDQLKSEFERSAGSLEGKFMSEIDFMKSQIKGELESTSTAIKDKIESLELQMNSMESRIIDALSSKLDEFCSKVRSPKIKRNWRIMHF